jgi:hypothetical protein
MLRTPSRKIKSATFFADYTRVILMLFDVNYKSCRGSLQ